MSSSQNEIAKYFQGLHKPGDALILCNAHDGGTAQIIAEHPHIKAIASASYAVATVQGVADEELSPERNLYGIKPIVAAGNASKKPVTVDIRDGYGDRLEEVIAAIIKLGVVGCNLEDFNDETKSLYTVEEAAARIKRAMKVASDLGVPNFVINARTDVLFIKPNATVADAVERGKAYIAAGATCLFVWGGAGAQRGVHDDEIKTLVKELNGMVSVLYSTQPGKLSLTAIKSIGVCRASMGPFPYYEVLAAYKKLADSVPA
ncbi:hypothetical protein GYMLUDRAFT_34337 [Collybiopsis luxurians FD-317 M1]|nr:hypothetical protein GYMLUDRAFT_34337 [Collybiopsis luxurians FD-317 M1]